MIRRKENTVGERSRKLDKGTRLEEDQGGGREGREKGGRRGGEREGRIGKGGRGEERVRPNQDGLASTRGVSPTCW